jgi:hypothetical protein
LFLADDGGVGMAFALGTLRARAQSGARLGPAAARALASSAPRTGLAAPRAHPALSGPKRQRQEGAAGSHRRPRGPGECRRHRLILRRPAHPCFSAAPHRIRERAACPGGAGASGISHCCMRALCLQHHHMQYPILHWPSRMYWCITTSCATGRGRGYAHPRPECQRDDLIHC